VRILFVHQGMWPYVERDLKILREAHEVVEIRFTGRKGVFKQLPTDLVRLWRGTIWCDATFSWFGKLHAFWAVLFSKLMGKKAIVVSGGDEVENCLVGGKPWGLCAHPLKRLFPMFAFRHADLILAHSEYNMRSTLQNAGAGPHKTRLIYHGVDGERFRAIPNIERDNIVVTVGVITRENLHRKGLKLFVRTAAMLPHRQFLLIGPDYDGAYLELKALAPSNVTFLGGLSGDELSEIFSRAKVYVQASECESFAVALAEAMLCECIPVVTRRAALPEVVGDCGFYVDRLEPEALAEKIEEALQAPGELGKRARQRILENFPLEKRRRELLGALDSLV
jgi:glycosyltransferase involved in cell wall biosynthesis